MTTEVKCVHYWIVDSQATRKGYYKICSKCGEEGFDPYVAKLPSLYPERKKKLVSNFINRPLPKYLDQS